jgi:hypothetical protein
MLGILYYHLLLFDIFEYDFPFGFWLSAFVFVFMTDILALRTPAPTYRPPGTQFFLAHMHCFLDSTKLKEDIMAKRDIEVPSCMRMG